MPLIRLETFIRAPAAVCYGIVTAHGGRVAVESGGGRRGTIVRVALPADGSAAAELAPRAPVVQTSPAGSF